MAKIEIDFTVNSSPYFIGVLDMSDWHLIEDQPAIIEITLPGYSSCVTKYFDKKKNNIYNSIHLEINCEDSCGKVEKLTLPDGIYKIKVTGSPDKYFKEAYYLKTDLFQMEVDKLYIEANKNRQLNIENFMNKMYLLDFMVGSAEAHLRFQDINMAGQLFQKAQEIVEDLKNCKSCFKN